MKLSSLLLVLSLLWSLVEVHSQTFPYVSFIGQTLANNSYVNISLVGTSGSDSVQCHTDLNTCCNGPQGPHRGDWYFPDGGRLPFSGDIYESREAQRVEIRRRNTTSQTGLYRCDIATNAVHDDTDQSVREAVYVGLYTASGGMIGVDHHSLTVWHINTIHYELPDSYSFSQSYTFCVLCSVFSLFFLCCSSCLQGGVTISGGVTLTVDSDLNGGSSQFTLTCISTGGPATTVTWTRDSTTVTEGKETVLNNATTATYTHTLTGNTAGIYTCTVANNKPSSASASITVQGIHR